MLMVAGTKTLYICCKEHWFFLSEVPCLRLYNIFCDMDVAQPRRWIIETATRVPNILASDLIETRPLLNCLRVCPWGPWLTACTLAFRKSCSSLWERHLPDCHQTPLETNELPLELNRERLQQKPNSLNPVYDCLWPNTKTSPEARPNFIPSLCILRQQQIKHIGINLIIILDLCTGGWRTEVRCCYSLCYICCRMHQE